MSIGRAWTVYLANTQFKKVWRFNGGGARGWTP